MKNLKQLNWAIIFLLCGLLGIAGGYLVAAIWKPSVIPPPLRFGGLNRSMNILLLGVDVVYTKEHRGLKADPKAFNGRSDTMMLAHLDPYRNSLSILSIPRDTTADIPGYGLQKINSANALGGPELARRTVSQLTGLEVNRYVVLNVHGLVDLVDKLGGITVNIPKRMKYRDRTAKLNIDLEAGPHTLTGTEAMGFVRFRHDALGDIGRVQRQEIFIRAVLEKGLSPGSWMKVPELLQCAQDYVSTDLNATEMMQVLNFMRSVPKEKQMMALLPGDFSGSGDWTVDTDELVKVVSRMRGASFPVSDRSAIKVAVESASSRRGLGRELGEYLHGLGYNVISSGGRSETFSTPQATTKIVADRGNVEEAQIVKGDLGQMGEVINASLGHLQSNVTVVVGDDAAVFLERKDQGGVSDKMSRGARGN